MEKNNSLPRATAEMAQRYNEMLKLNLTELNSDQLATLNEEYADMEENYDWYNYEFTDPATGKVGVKDVAGNILVPALYDGACYVEHYMFSPHFPHVMERDGMCGIVATDGSGQELSAFVYDSAQHIVGTPVFAARWGGVKDRFGIITCDGTVLVDNILTKYYEVHDGIMVIERDGKQGVIDLNTFQVVMPEYDEVEALPDEYVTFTLNGVQGRVDENGKFYTLEEADQLDLPNSEIDFVYDDHEYSY